MGKWAQYQKRGGTGFTGQVAMPGAAEWTVSSPAAGQARGTAAIALPAGVTGITSRARLTGTGGAFVAGSTGVAFSTITGLTTGQTYDVQVAWSTNLVQSSDWSAVKTQLIT